MVKNRRSSILDALLLCCFRVGMVSLTMERNDDYVNNDDDFDDDVEEDVPTVGIRPVKQQPQQPPYQQPYQPPQPQYPPYQPQYPPPQPQYQQPYQQPYPPPYPQYHQPQPYQQPYQQPRQQSYPPPQPQYRYPEPSATVVKKHSRSNRLQESRKLFEDLAIALGHRHSDIANAKTQGQLLYNRIKGDRNRLDGELTKVSDFIEATKRGDQQRCDYVFNYMTPETKESIGYLRNRAQDQYQYQPCYQQPPPPSSHGMSLQEPSAQQLLGGVKNKVSKPSRPPIEEPNEERTKQAVKMIDDNKHVVNEDNQNKLIRWRQGLVKFNDPDVADLMLSKITEMLNISEKENEVGNQEIELDNEIKL